MGISPAIPQGNRPEAAPSWMMGAPQAFWGIKQAPNGCPYGFQPGRGARFISTAAESPITEMRCIAWNQRRRKIQV